MIDLKKTTLACYLLFALFCTSFASADINAAFKIMLVGDSTTIGSLPREVNPAGPHLER